MKNHGSRLRGAPVGILAFALAVSVFGLGRAQSVPVPDAPEVRPQNHVVALTLRAVSADDGRDAFSFNGQTVPPVIRVLTSRHCRNPRRSSW